jgi:HEAT repeat protein
MIGTLVTLVCAATQPPAASPGQVAQADSAVEQRVQSYLGAIDRPIPDGAWQRLGPQAAPILERIAQDANELPTRRAKALDGLAAVGSATAPSTMLALANDEQQPLVVRIAAVHGAARVVPKTQVVAKLQPLLQRASNGHVRRAAAEEIADHGGCTAVRQQASRETERGFLSRALEKCGE